MKTCLICDRIQLSKKGANDFFVTELQTGIVVLGDNQYFNGYTLFLSKIHVTELHQHPNYELFLKEATQVGEAVWKSFHPKKLNYEILGNEHPHLHVHIFPRSTDPLIGKPLYYIPQKERTSPKTIPTTHQLQEMKSKLLNNLPL